METNCLRDKIIKTYCATFGKDYLHITKNAMEWIEHLQNEIGSSVRVFAWEQGGAKHALYLNLELHENGEFAKLLRPFYIENNCLYAL